MNDKVYETSTIQDIESLVESFIKECDELTQKLKDTQETLKRLRGEEDADD